ncbi:nucleoside deaminase [Poriferisphaera sp. WC338]|uniref:nucleoside deaminase n=1 Tax=Poriferisphaera sp. WC338 TaxID=3425129 RepID=UPI003D81BA3A
MTTSDPSSSSHQQLAHDQHMMRLAIAQAQLAANLGEVPIGAVVYKQDPDHPHDPDRTTVLAAAHNLRESAADPTAHAEILALKQAAQSLGTWHLDDCGIAITLEPCPMCAGAMINARLGHCIYALTDPKMGCAHTLYSLLEDTRFNHRLPSRAGILEAECLSLLQSFFQARRTKDKPPKPTFNPENATD